MIYLSGLIISSAVSGWALFTIMDALYERKYLNSKLCYRGALCLYVVLSVIVAMQKFPGINVIFSMVILCLMSTLIYKTYRKNVVINSAIIIIYFALVDLIVTTIFSLFTNVNLNIALGNSQFFLISGICNALVMLCTCNLLIQLILRSQIGKVSMSIHFYTVFLLIFEVSVLCYFMADHRSSSNSVGLLVLSIGFVIVDGGVIYLFKMLSKNAILEKQTQLAEQQCNMTVKYYEALQKQYDETQRLIHDFKKHICVIENLETNQKEIKKKYIDEMKESINEVHYQFQCEDEILCTIIWEKMQVCRQENITLELNLQDIKFDFMRKSEVTSLFANLLDNAIEACRGCNSSKKEIRLRIHSFNHYIVIGMQNTIDTIPRCRNGNLLSTKPGHLGLGMEIISNIANKYYGNIDFDYSQDYFETKIILSTIHL